MLLKFKTALFKFRFRDLFLGDAGAVVADGLIKSNICIVLYEIFFLLIFFNPLLGIFTGYITTKKVRISDIQ